MRRLMLSQSEKCVPPTRRHLVELWQLIEEMVNSGALLATEGLLPSEGGARVRFSGGKLTNAKR